MKPKTPHIVVTFHTTAEAMATEKACKNADLPGKLISAPRSITADCGIAWSGPAKTAPQLKALILSEAIEIDGYYEMML